MNLILLLAAAATPAPASGETIVITASREPVSRSQASVSTDIVDEETLEALALPAAADILRLVPGVSVGVSGPRGSQTQLRIRGAEANHTLLFVDGIRFNDPAAANEARFELLTTDALSRVEIVRGPQSALWGSEALGGVVAVETANARDGTDLSTLAEYGSLDSFRVSGQGAIRAGALGLSGSATWQGSEGIDSFAGGPVERDGFANRSGHLKGVYGLGGGSELGIAGHWVEGRSEYDGFDPATFRRADTGDETRNRIGAVRGWGRIERGGWTASADLSFLDSANRNRLDDAPLNRTAGERLAAGAQVSRTLGRHRLTVALEHEAEDFRARDQSAFGATDQDRSRHLTAAVAEWRAQWLGALTTDIAVRHDDFSAFGDATTVRASALLRPGGGFQIHAGYGEGIAQPSFYDLFGFFPGSFVGNPALTPERSSGWEAGIGWRGSGLELGLTGFTHRLEDEIIDTFDPVTFTAGAANATGTSRRRGVEVEAAFRPSERMHFAFNYTFLDSEEGRVAGAGSVREVRRPRHSANIVAAGKAGALSWGATLAYVGKRRDTDFDVFPSQAVTLDDYWLGSLRLGWKVGKRLEAFARVENLLDSRYQDVVGYRTAGRTAYAGLRFRFRD
jgi:vitamin B12 transporter